MKERQKKKQQKRDAEKEKSGQYLTSKDLVSLKEVMIVTIMNHEYIPLHHSNQL